MTGEVSLKLARTYKGNYKQLFLPPSPLPSFST